MAIEVLKERSEDQTKKIEHSRLHRTMSMLSVGFAGALVIFCCLYLDERPSVLKYTVISSTLLALINAFVVCNVQNHKIRTFSVATLTLYMALALVYSGGYQGTGLLWAYALAPVVFTVFGATGGLVASVLSVIGFATLLNWSWFDVNHYTSPQVSRFLISFTVLSSVMFVKEYFSEIGMQNLATLSDDNQLKANQDPLTGLPNRRFVDSIYFEKIKRMPESYFPMTLAVVDLDHFKSVNDTMGHDGGDYVLKHVSNVLQKNLREGDIVARTGGEEFLILLPKTSFEQGFNVIDKLRDKVNTTPLKDASLQAKLPRELSISAGAACVMNVESKDDSIKADDVAMYDAKQRGRNRVCSAKGEVKLESPEPKVGKRSGDIHVQPSH